MAKQKEEALSDRDFEVRANAAFDLEAMVAARDASSEIELEETEEDEIETEEAETEETEEEETETDEKVAVELPQRKTGKNSK